MNAVDIICIILLVVAIRLGAHFGLVRQTFVSLGFVAGLFTAASIQYLFASSSKVGSEELFFWMLAIMSLLVIGLFCDFGLSIGRHVQKKVDMFKSLEFVDVVGGSIVAGLTGITFMLIGSALAMQTPNQALSSQLQTSLVVNSLRQTFPKLPSLFVQAANLLNPHGLPRVFAGIEPNLEATVTLPDDAFTAPLAAAAAPSVLKVTNNSCGGTATGTGFVAGTNLLITNAHVVSGAKTPQVWDSAGVHSARVVLFDPLLDVAILAVPDMRANTLSLNTATLSPYAPAITLGYASGNPGVQAARVQQRITAEGYDIYNQSLVARTVYVLHDNIEQGDSGGPVIDQNGLVVGVVFAKSSSETGIGYALTADQVAAKLKAVSFDSPTANTGKCGSR